jgi:ribosomal silencing factor RsfS
MSNSKDKVLDPRGLDVHGAEPVTHRFTITDADGNADVELNFSFPLTRKRHALLEHLLEEGYSEHEAYVLIAGGEIMSHIQGIKSRKPGS